MDYLGSALHKLRPRRRSVGTIPTLQVIPDNDEPVEIFTPDDPEEASRISQYRRQSKRRASCPAPNAQVC
ncbi:hypothetical protein DPMN_059256 [Dreissena polymorpha]|uniref:Uncharacterized protein n=1 Tax=Dreissena polymorpha TaxID=45954 RepID=A0A9D4C3S3_DREPO|nr:hypothetical protein DPMN_059256 [Dreissena polymorpha]